MIFEPILALVILTADIWAIVQIVQSRHTRGTKLFWVLIIICLPVLGLLAWLVFGKKSAPAV